MASLRRAGVALAGLALVVLASGAQARIVVESIPGLEFSGSLFNYGNFRWQGKSNHPSYFNLVAITTGRNFRAACLRRCVDRPPGSVSTQT